MVTPRRSEITHCRRRRLADRDWQPERAAHGAPQGFPAERISRALGRDHACSTAAVRGSDDSAHIPGVLNAVEQQTNCGVLARASSSEAVFGVRQGDNARGLTDRTHRCHHWRRYADDLRARALDAVDEPVGDIDVGLGKRDRFELDA